MKDGLNKNPVRKSLIRTPLFAGVELRFLLLEALMIVVVFIWFGISIITPIVGLGIVMMLHPALVWMTKNDKEMIAVVLASLFQQDYYPDHAGAETIPPKPKDSIPKIN